MFTGQNIAFYVIYIVCVSVEVISLLPHPFLNPSRPHYVSKSNAFIEYSLVVYMWIRP